MKESSKFYEEILGFTNLGENDQGLLGLKINETTILFLERSNDHDSSPWSQGTHHYAFGMDARGFESVFSSIKAHNVPF